MPRSRLKEPPVQQYVTSAWPGSGKSSTVGLVQQYKMATHGQYKVLHSQVYCL
jgi:hypothetical protein